MKSIEYEEAKVKYQTLSHKCDGLGINLREALIGFLTKENIDYLDVSYRVKKFDSFWEKNKRKRCKNPFNEIEDVCGLRILCYYISDLDRITNIIKTEFNIKESIDKSDLLEPDKFGYRSLHFIVTIKKAWSKAPNYRGLSNQKVEIQVRTNLMHAWAEIEHKLAYKKKEHIPQIFRRKLYRLSALFEIADDEFNKVWNEKSDYIEDLSSITGKRLDELLITSELNLDVFQVFLNKNFPDRDMDPDDAAELLDRLNKFDITLEIITNSIEKVKDIINDVELDSKKNVNMNINDEPLWTQCGIVRMILDLTNDKWYKNRSIGLKGRKTKEKWRKKLKEG